MLVRSAHDGAWGALVLAAGLATRLRPLSLVRAKAAMPVAGESIIGRILIWLRQAGLTRVVINLHHRAESITHAVGDGRAYGVAVRYSWEPVVLGSAGGPRSALPLLDCDRAIIVNGDTLTNCDLTALRAQHVASGAAVTMAVVPGDVTRYGGVVVRDNGRVSGFVRAGAAPPAGATVQHFIGAQAVNLSVFAGLAVDQPAETVRQLYPDLIAAQRDAIGAFVSRADFHDVGTARDYLETSHTFAAREARPPERGADVVIHDSAVLDDCVVWDRVRIGAGVHLTRCIVADDVTVPAGVRLSQHVLVAAPGGFSASPL